jgi:uncharacterized Zn finger protein (UPF0148 family)
LEMHCKECCAVLFKRTDSGEIGDPSYASAS